MTLSFHQCCRAIVAARGQPALNYAVGYAAAGLALSDHEAQRVQALYILNNITHWRGPTAQDVRAGLKALGKEVRA